MSTPFDDVFGEVATDLIELFGVQQGDSDLTKGSYSQVTFGRVDRKTREATKTVVTKALDMSPPLAYKIKDLIPGLIEAGDCKILIAGRDWDVAFPGSSPKTNDIISVNNISFFIKPLEPIYSGNDVALYVLRVRQGHAK